MYQHSKVLSEVGIDPQSLPYGFQNEIIDHSCLDRGPKTIGLDVPNLRNDVPNLLRMYQGFQSAFRGGDQPPITSLWVPK